MKADDDTFINIFHIKKYLVRYSDFEPTADSDEGKEKEKGQPKVLSNTPKTLDSHSNSSPRSLICPLYGQMSMPILRDKKKCMKWCVSKTDLPGLTHYPRYCAGLIYFFTMPLVKQLYAAVKVGTSVSQYYFKCLVHKTLHEILLIIAPMT